ncbi:S41 family peptidase [Pontiella sp.]|uniref:S41 family peptidase n=1 Tax=Pontiella sp. TaxID=2837462 RepID=UPI003562F9EA
MKWMVAFLLLAAGSAQADREQVQLASLPALTPDGKTLVFEYRRDLWVASSKGGEARPLTTHPANDSRPVISPDGTRVAFMSNRNEHWQTFVVPLEGGTPRQLTFHSEGSVPRAWYPDGKSLIVSGSRANMGHIQNRLFRVDCDGAGEPEMLFNAYASEVSLAPDGERLLFTRKGERTYRKGYRGSNSSEIWLRNLATGDQELLRDFETSCRSPIWKPDGKGFYYVGQQDGCFNVREYDLNSGADIGLTTFTDTSVIVPTLSANGKVMVFRNLFDFYRMDPRKPGSLRKIDLWIDTDTPPEKTRRRYYDKAWNNDEWGTLSTTQDGLELCFTAGGDLWAMDTVLREPVAVCADAATHEREAVFSTDGQTIYFLRDDGLGVNIWKAERADDALGWWENKAFVLTPITQDQISRARLSISPDGARLAVAETGHELWTMNPDGSERRRQMASPFDIYYDWSPDGRWLVCSARDSWGNNDIWIADESGEQAPYNLSRHPNWDWNPRWSPDGKAIAYIGKRYDEKTDIYYVWLNREDEVTNPRMRTREEARKTIADTRKKKGNDKDEDEKSGNGDSALVKIDFDGLSKRVHRIELDGTPRDLFWSYDSKALAFQSKIDGKDGTWKVLFPEPGKPVFMTPEKGIHAQWLKKDGKIVWLSDGVPAAYTKKYPFKVYNEVDLVAYRRLAFRIMWRNFRDEFYDPALNNRDWEAVRSRYEEQAAHATSWDSFGRIAEMLMGELNGSHLGFEQTKDSKKEWNPDYSPRQGWGQRTAALGLVFDETYEGDGLKVAHVVRNSAADRQEPRVQAGEILLAIDGAKVGNGSLMDQLLTGHASRDIDLLVLGTNGVERTVMVEEDSYAHLRELVREDWMEHNREIVEQVGNGRCGYLNIEKMNFDSLRRFEKEIYACGFGKDGLVIDVRNNPGGFISDLLLSILCHPKHAVTVPREGSASYQQGYLPSAAWFKPIVVLCNEYSASNSEIFCHAIKTLQRGKIVGVPTQRAVISTNTKKVLDVGNMRMPHRGWFRIEDGRDMEMQPCVPDVIVHNAPGDVPAGRDPQLVRAVEELLKEIESAPPAFPEPIYASDREK